MGENYHLDSLERVRDEGKHELRSLYPDIILRIHPDKLALALLQSLYLERGESLVSKRLLRNALAEGSKNSLEEGVIAGACEEFVQSSTEKIR